MSVIQDGVVPTAQKTSTSVPVIHVRMVGSAWMALIDTRVTALVDGPASIVKLRHKVSDCCLLFCFFNGVGAGANYNSLFFYNFILCHVTIYYKGACL